MMALAYVTMYNLYINKMLLGYYVKGDMVAFLVEKNGGRNYMKKAFGVILFLILGFHAVWILNIAIYYKPFIEQMGYSCLQGSCVSHIDGYDVGVNIPSYPTFTGNLYVSKNVDLTSESEIVTTSLILWPTWNGDVEAGIVIHKNQWNGTSNTMTIENKYLYVDKDMTLLYPDDEEQQRLYEDNYEDILACFQVVQETWKISD